MATQAPAFGGIGTDADGFPTGLTPAASPAVKSADGIGTDADGFPTGLTPARPSPSLAGPKAVTAASGPGRLQQAFSSARGGWEALTGENPAPPRPRAPDIPGEIWPGHPSTPRYNPPADWEQVAAYSGPEVRAQLGLGAPAAAKASSGAAPATPESFRTPAAGQPIWQTPAEAEAARIKSRQIGGMSGVPGLAAPGAPPFHIASSQQPYLQAAEQQATAPGKRTIGRAPRAPGGEAIAGLTVDPYASSAGQAREIAGASGYMGEVAGGLGQMARGVTAAPRAVRTAKSQRAAGEPGLAQQTLAAAPGQQQRELQSGLARFGQGAISGAMLEAMPELAIEQPGRMALGLAGSAAGGRLAHAAARKLGATPEEAAQAATAGNVIGGLIGDAGALGLGRREAFAHFFGPAVESAFEYDLATPEGRAEWLNEQYPGWDKVQGPGAENAREYVRSGGLWGPIEPEAGLLPAAGPRSVNETATRAPGVALSLPEGPAAGSRANPRAARASSVYEAQRQLPRGVATGAGQPLAEPNGNVIREVAPTPVPPGGRLLPAAPDAVVAAHAPRHAIRFVSAPSGGLIQTGAGRFMAVPEGGGLINLGETSAPRPEWVRPIAGLLPAARPEAEDVAEAPSEAIEAAKLAGPAVAGAAGKATLLKTTEGDFPARYKVIEARDLTPSHHAGTFGANPSYPSGVQERGYHSSAAAQGRVAEQAANFQPEFLLNTNPDAVNGPPVVTPNGVVLGGNSRAMTVQRVYGAGERGRGAGYKQALVGQARMFGLKPQAIAAMRQPVLVRELEQPPRSIGEAATLARNLNRNFTGALSDAEMAASRGRAVSEGTLGAIGDLIAAAGEHATLADALEKRPVKVMDLLQRDGVISQRERPALQDARTGALTARGKDFVTKALVGAVLPDADLIASAPASVVQKITRALPALAQLRATGNGWDLTGPLQEAVQIQTAARAQGMPVEDYLSQQDLFGHEAAPEAAMLARALEDTPRAFARRMEQLASAARANAPGQGLLPGVEAERPEQAMGRVLGGGVKARAVAHSLGGNTGKALAQPVGVSDAHGLVGVLYGRGDARALSLALGAPVGKIAAGAEVPAWAVAGAVQTLQQAGHRGLAMALTEAAMRTARPSFAVVLLGDDEDSTMRALEEHAHMLQSALSGTHHADDAFNDAEAAGLLASSPLWVAAGAGITAIYGPQSLRATVAEIGAHALAGDWHSLGLSAVEGERLRAEYVAALDGKFGTERINAELQSLFVPLGDVVAGARAGKAAGKPVVGFNALARTASRGGGGGTATAPPGNQGTANAAGHPIWRSFALVGRIQPEPERGPVARAFRFFDRALEPAAQAAGKVEAGLSKYHGVSTPARQALRGYEGRRGFAAIAQSRAGAALYSVVKRALGVKRLDQALPHLLKIEHAIEEPQNPEYKLTAAEQEVKAALVEARDAITAHDVARGWLTPEALLPRTAGGPGTPETRGASLQTVEPERRKVAEAALGEWDRLKRRLGIEPEQKDVQARISEALAAAGI